MNPQDARRVSDILYSKLLGDSEIAAFFRGVDLEAQTRRMASALSDTERFSDPLEWKRLVEVHVPLLRRGLRTGHFDRVVEYLVQTLEETGLVAHQAAILDTFGPMRTAIFELSST